MALARLTAFASLIVGGALAVLVPDVEGAGPASLAGWVAVAVLALAVVGGEPVALMVATAIFVVRLGMLAPLDGPVVPPVWVQSLLIVAFVELAVVSIERRTRPRLNVIALSRASVAAMVAAVVALVMESAVYGSSGGGSLLRAAAVAALTVLIGWILWMWRNALSPPPEG